MAGHRQPEAPHSQSEPPAAKPPSEMSSLEHFLSDYTVVPALAGFTAPEPLPSTGGDGQHRPR
jgi:hypothetical protein